VNPSPADRADASVPARPRQLRAFALLTLAVLAAHLALLQGASLRLPLGGVAAPTSAPMHTRLLAAADAPPPTQAATAAPPPPPPRPARVRSRPTAAEAPILEETTPYPSAKTSVDAIEIEVTGTPPGAVAGPEPTAAPTVAQATSTVAPASAASAAAPAPAPATQTAEAPPPAPPTAPILPGESGAAQAPLAGSLAVAVRLPPPMRLAYEVEGRIKGLPYRASGELRWQHDASRYALRGEISALFLGARVQSSTGRIAALGLAPQRFSDKVRSELAAHFEPEAQRVRFSANTPDAVLLPLAQDRLSLFFQIGAMFAAAPERFAPGRSLTLQIVGARDAEPWRFDIGPDEVLDLPIGATTARRFTREPRREHDLRLDFWLAPALDGLPVRIRLTQSNGDRVEQNLRAAEPLDATAPPADARAE
jgi:hypothetical protein